MTGNFDWAYLFEISLTGIAGGGLYALAALAFVMVYKATRVVNIAIGEMLMAGGYLFFTFAAMWALPLWLAPVQAMVLNISEHQATYAENVAQKLRQSGLRAEADLRNEKITYKIREPSLNKLPYQLVVGDKEMAAGLVAVRTRGGQDLGQMTLEALIERLSKEVAARSGTA